MADYTQSKQNFAGQMQAVATQVLRLAAQITELNAAYSVHGFQPSGANAFTNQDFTTTNPHLSAAIVADTMFAIGTLDQALTTGVLNSLRECLPGGIV